MRKHLLPLLLAPFFLSACGDTKLEDPGTPKSQRQQRREHNGNLTGEDQGFVLAGPSSKSNAEGGALGVNSYLWRATLDTLAFMPLASADPFGGVIITDWYEDPKTPGERFKVNALILDKSLRTDGVKLTVFKQKLEKGTWHDKTVDPSLASTLEDTILTRARQLRVTQLK